MDVLGVTLPADLTSFYQEVEALFADQGVMLTCEWIEGPEFGGFYPNGPIATVGIRSDLPPEAIPHTLAHELVHGLQRQEAWPKAIGNPERGDDSPAEQVASVLQGIIHCTAAELRIAPLGLDPSWEQRERHQMVRLMLRAPDADAARRGTPLWAYWSLLYTYIGLLHPPEHTRTLLRNIERALPAAAEAGREVMDLVREHGYATREQALSSLRAVQRALELGPNILIEDPLTGLVYDGLEADAEQPA